MKTLLASAAAAALSLTLGASAQAQTVDPAWYVRVDGGGALQDKLNASPKIDGKAGWAVDAAVGRSLGNNFRADAELGYSESKAKSGLGGHLKTVTGLVNGYYDVDTGTAWKPFVGAGVGFGQVKLDGGPFHDDDTGFAYQLQAGVAYPINEKLSSQVSWRYLGINDVTLNGPLGRINGDYHDQRVMLGLTYKFGF